MARERHSFALDVVRIIPAVIVAVHHIVLALFGFRWPEQWYGRALYAPAIFLGLPAVVLLVVLSGYVVGGDALRAARERSPWRADVYALNRLTRLWTVLIPALALTGIADIVGMALFRRTGVYGGHVVSVIAYDVRNTLSVLSGLGSATFLAPFQSPIFGSNIALWTVAYEFWFYLMGPLVFFTLFSGPLLRKANALRIAVLFGCLFIINEHVMMFFVFWLLGALAAQLPVRRSPQPRLFLLVCLAFVAAFTGLGQLNRAGEYYGMLYGSAVVFAALVPLLTAYEPAGDFALRRVAARFAGSAYSLYAIHTPLVVLASAALTRATSTDQLWRYTPAAMAVVAGLFAALVLLARVFAAFTEDRRADARRFVRDWAGRLASP